MTITAKEKLCFCEKTECTPEKCPWAKGHFDRVNDAVYELWTAEQSFSREKILEQAEKWKVCPFEMCLDLSSWVDGVICDYNYVFDPNVKLKRFLETEYPETIFFLLMKLIIWQSGAGKCTAPVLPEKMLWKSGSI